MMKKILDFFSVFGSTGTLVCCAIPAVLSVIAGGAAVSAFVTVFPWVIPISRYKGWLFLVAGILLIINGVLTLKPKSKMVCAITGGKGCEVAGGFTKVVFWFAVTVYCIGAFAAYALVPLLIFFEG